MRCIVIITASALGIMLGASACGGNSNPYYASGYAAGQTTDIQQAVQQGTLRAPAQQPLKTSVFLMCQLIAQQPGIIAPTADDQLEWAKGCAAAVDASQNL